MTTPNKYVLMSDEVTIKVNSNVLKYPSLKARSKVEGDTCIVYMKDTSVMFMVTLAKIIEGKHIFTSVHNDIILLRSLADDKLEEAYAKSWTGLVYNPINDFPSKQVQQVESSPVLESMPVDWLLINKHTFKAALSHPNISECNLKALNLGLYYCVDDTVKEPIWLTNEFENLPHIVAPMSTLTPYKIDFNVDNPIIRKINTAYRVPKYNYVKYAIKESIAKDDVISRLILDDHVVIFGKSISRYLFDTGYMNLQLCIKNPKNLDVVLSYFPKVSVIENKENHMIINVGDRQCIFLWYPENYRSFISSQSLSIYRCYYDKEIYMTVSCMLSIMTNRLVYNTDYNNEEIENLLNQGFCFLQSQIPRIDSAEEIELDDDMFEDTDVYMSRTVTDKSNYFL